VDPAASRVFGTFGWVVAVVWLVWGAAASGLTSSNDGSHVALARALAVRGQTTIDPDAALTLRVDVARKDGHLYSDRPPGAAFLALPAVWLGHRLDRMLAPLVRDQAHAREHANTVEHVPAASAYVHTYMKRGGALDALFGMRATLWLVVIHALVVGLLGLWCVDATLRRQEYGVVARRFAVLSLALASAFGPYSTVLFAHGTAATMMAACMLALVRTSRDDQSTVAWPLLAGLAGGWAIASDYLLVLAVVPLVLLQAPRRSWPAILLGAMPIVVATLAYHAAAFSSPFAIGYDFQQNFAFARARASTFDGNVLHGAWVLLGAGDGAGLLAQSPITLVGIGTLAYARRFRLLLPWTPWLVALCLHHTPTGGATVDHRYLVPMLPLAAVGLAHVWQLATTERRISWILLAISFTSAFAVWKHVFTWQESRPFPHPMHGLVGALVVGTVCMVARRASLISSRQP